MEWCWKSETSFTALGIIRVSSHKQSDGVSPDAQEREIRKYCEERGLNILRIVRIQESAKDSDKRKLYDKEIKWALKGKVRHILFYMSDREARNMTDVEASNKLIMAGKIVIHHVVDRKVYWEKSSTSDFFVRNLNSVVNHDFSLRLTARVESALRAKAEMGHYPHANPPLGYVGKRAINAHGRESSKGMSIVVRDPNSEAVNLVQIEFRMRARGHSIDSIYEYVKASKIKIPANVKNYSPKGIEHRLKNPFYSGYFFYKGTEYKGKHEIIIPESDLKAVKRSFDVGRGFAVKPENHQAIFGQWIRCGLPGCSNVVVYDPKDKFLPSIGEKKTYHYYHCGNSQRQHPTLKNVSEESLFEQFESALPVIQISEEFAADIVIAMAKRDRLSAQEERDRAAKLKKALSELDRNEDECFDFLKSGVLDESSFKRQKARIRSEKEGILTELNKTESASHDIQLMDVKKLLELCKDVKSLWIKLEKEDRVRMLKNIYSNPILIDGTVRFHLRKPFAIIAEMKRIEPWYPPPDSNWHTSRQWILTLLRGLYHHLITEGWALFHSAVTPTYFLYFKPSRDSTGSL